MAQKYPHQGITMHHLGVDSNFPGLLFTVGSVLIFLFAIPALWFVVAAAVLIGIAIALYRMLKPSASHEPTFLRLH
jgi:hypothetical protein